MIPGVTETVVPLNDPGIHAYVEAPPPVSVVLLPAQMVGLPAEAVTVGVGFTVIIRVPVEVHPLAAVPVTVYVVVMAGETVTGEPLNDPGIHVYVEAPAPVSVVLAPLHIVVDDAVAVTVGEASTVIVCVVVPVPFTLVAVCVTV